MATNSIVEEPCVHIHGIYFNSDGDDNVMEKMLHRYGHRVSLILIGKSSFYKKKKKEIRSIIIKFRSWKSRTTFYKARPRNHLIDKTYQDPISMFFWI